LVREHLRGVGRVPGPNQPDVPDAFVDISKIEDEVPTVVGITGV